MAEPDPASQAGEENEEGTREEFQILAVDDKVIVNFGQAIHWLGFTPAQALEFARILKLKAREARKNAPSSNSRYNA